MPKTLKLIVLALLVNCTGPKGTAENLTGTWQGPVDLGARTGLLRFVLIDDGGVLNGREQVNDPLDPAIFRTIDVVSGTFRSGTMTLVTPRDTITADLDGGVLTGVDPFTLPPGLVDGGPRQLNMRFTMTRTSADTSALDQEL